MALIKESLGISERNKVIGRVFSGNPNLLFKDVLHESAPSILADLHLKKKDISSRSVEITPGI